jgi:putative ABC transport system permease protein
MILVRLLIQTVFLALAQIWANKARALLTSLGIIIGVSSVIAVIAALGGLKGFVLSEVEKFGASKVWLWGFVPPEQRTSMSWSDAMLSLWETRQIAENCDSIAKITPMTDTRYDVQHGKTTQKGVQVTGIWPAWHEIENRYITQGRPFIRADEDEARQVCIVNDKAIEELRLDQDPVGSFLLVKDRRFLIVGVVETKEVSPMFGGGDSRSELLIPFSTARTMNPYNWMMAMAQLKSPELADEAREEIRFVLRKERGLRGDDPDTFQVEILQSAIDQFNAMAAAITIVAGGIVSISLLVGGIGIMNIMLVSVSERTREIGLRKAVGAKPSVVLLQFLVEAVVLCVAGGVVGLLLGQAMVFGLKHIPHFPLEHATVPVWAVVLSIAFSAGVGVVFGMFPAVKAARLDPIAALRHE